jgi:hypothetical protein
MIDGRARGVRNWSCWSSTLTIWYFMSKYWVEIGILRFWGMYHLMEELSKQAERNR